MEQQDYLLELESEITLEHATTGARFANYVIDIIGFYILFFALVVGILVSARIFQTGETRFVFYFISYLTYLLYYTLLEGGTGGRTLGKLITKTVVVKEDGSPITWKDALLRSLCRLVPFEPFSAFGSHPWHDKWTKTMVVKKQ